MPSDIPHAWPYQAVFFDFDGVLADSAQIKAQAFRSLYEEHGPDIVEAAVAHHAAHEGVSRVIKIAYCHREFLGIDLDDAALSALVQRYQAIVEHQVIACDPIEGALEFLEFCHGAAPLFVASGTPQDELRRIVSARGMEHYFTEVRGSPDTKDVIVRAASAQHGFDPSKALFLGDAMTDHDAARACGCEFIGVVAAGRDSPFPGGTPVVPNLGVLLVTLQSS